MAPAALAGGPRLGSRCILLVLAGLVPGNGLLDIFERQKQLLAPQRRAWCNECGSALWCIGSSVTLAGPPLSFHGSRFAPLSRYAANRRFGSSSPVKLASATEGLP